jgi:glyoxylase-like metal-dependent hydrolase (beta-lactamase superfamily II)
MEVAEGIHCLTNGVTNFYLIQESGKLVLVDAGAPKDWALFTQAVLGLGRAVEDLDAVLLTHAHTDHTGFAEQARTTTGARVWIHEREVRTALTGKVGPRDGKTSAYLLRGVGRRSGRPGPPGRHDVMEEDMSRFPTPGHLVSWAKFAPRARQSADRSKAATTGRVDPPYREMKVAIRNGLPGPFRAEEAGHLTGRDGE